MNSLSIFSFCCPSKKPPKEFDTKINPSEMNVNSRQYVSAQLCIAYARNENSSELTNSQNANTATTATSIGVGLINYGNGQGPSLTMTSQELSSSYISPVDINSSSIAPNTISSSRKTQYLSAQVVFPIQGRVSEIINGFNSLSNEGAKLRR